MGSPKALVPCRGRTFLEHLLAAVDANRAPNASAKGPAVSPCIGWVRVVVGAHAAEITSKLALDPGSIVVNPDWKLGQLSSIQAGIRSLPEGRTDGMMLFLVDHPLVSAELVGKLAGEFHQSRKAIVVPKFRGKRGHPVIFARRLYDELLAAPLDQGARTVVWAHAADVLEVPTEEEGVVLNLNDPEALRRLLERESV